MPVSYARWSCVLIGLAGLAMSAAVLTMLATQPDRIEAHMQRFVVYQVEKGTREALNETEDGGLAGNAMHRLARKFDDKAFRLQHSVADRVPLIVATILQDRCKGDCPEAELLEDIGLQLVLGAAMELRVKGATLREFVNERYDRTVRGLFADLWIFCFVNAAAFATILLLSTIRGATVTRPVLKLTLLMTTSVLVSVSFYVFGQDWFSTILLNQFVGWAYLVWMLVLLGILIDIGFLRGWITNALANALGAAFSVLPI
jgi:hypothetical protein